MPAEHGEASANNEGYILNHVAIKVASVAASKAFYVDFLGMKELFTIETGRFAAHYLGSALTARESAQEIHSSMPSRSGLLELIAVPTATTSDGDQISNPDRSNKSLDRKSAYGFVHLGFRVPDVAQTMQRARQLGWTILKDVDETEIMPAALPGRTVERTGEWKEDFRPILARIGFVADPDM